MLARPASFIVTVISETIDFIFDYAAEVFRNCLIMARLSKHG